MCVCVRPLTSIDRHTPSPTSHHCTFLTPDKRIQAWVRIGLQRLLVPPSPLTQPPLVSSQHKAFSWPQSLDPVDPLSLSSGPRVMIRAREGLRLGCWPPLSAVWLNGTQAIVIHNVVVSTSTLLLWAVSQYSWVMSVCVVECAGALEVCVMVSREQLLEEIIINFQTPIWLIKE